VFQAYGSVYTLVLMALDRYLAIVHPVRSIGWRTVRKTAVVLAITWVTIISTCTYSAVYTLQSFMFFTLCVACP